MNSIQEIDKFVNDRLIGVIRVLNEPRSDERTWRLRLNCGEKEMIVAWDGHERFYLTYDKPDGMMASDTILDLEDVFTFVAKYFKS
jgi:hypothetical protein